MGMLRGGMLAECALVLVMVLTALPPAMGAISWGIATDPDHPGTCLLREGNTAIRMKNGEDRYLPDCMLASCYKDGEDMVLTYYSCGHGQVIGCRPFRDMSKPYPGCCEVTCAKPKRPSLIGAALRARHP